MSKKRSNILILVLVLFGSSGLSFILNIPMENTIDNSSNTIGNEDIIVPTTSAYMDSIILDGIINQAEWANATHVAEFYMDLENTDNNVDTYNYLYLGEDEDNLYIGIDLCGDQSNNTAGEWVSAFLNTNKSTFAGTADWEKAINNGAESLIYDVENNKTWDYFTNIINPTNPKQYSNENITSVYGSTSGSQSDMQFNSDTNFFNITSIQNNTRHIAWTDFEFNISEIFPLFSEEYFKSISYIRFNFYVRNNVSVDSQKMVFWYNNGTYNITDTSHVFDINTGTSTIPESFDFYPQNASQNETIKFSIFGNHSAPFLHQIDYLRATIYSNSTNGAANIQYPYSSLKDNYILNWSFTPSSKNAANHRQFEFKIPKLELEGYTSNEELGIIVGGYGTAGFENLDYWVYSNFISGFMHESYTAYRYFSMDTTDVSEISLDGTISEAEWINASQKIDFYLEVDNDNADAYNYLYLAEDYENLYVGLDLCSDITGNTDDEWLGLWLNTDNRTFSSESQWEQTLDQGAESLLYSVENDTIWTMFNQSQINPLATNRTDSPYFFNTITGSSNGDSNSFKNHDGDYYSVVSDGNNETRTDVEIDVSSLYMGDWQRTYLDNLAYINISLSSFVNKSIDSNKIVVWYENETLDQNDLAQIIPINKDPGLLLEDIQIDPRNMYMNGGGSQRIKFSIIGNHSTSFNHSIDFLSYGLIAYEPLYPDGDFSTTFPISTIRNFEIKWTFGPSSNNLTNHRQFEIKIPRSELEYYLEDQDLGIKIGGYGTLSFPGTNWWIFSTQDSGLTPQLSNTYNHYDMSENVKALKEKLEQVNEKLCKKGEAYRKRRMAAGEKSSAYLSGRAVKVCKGQMSGKKKKK